MMKRWYSRIRITFEGIHNDLMRMSTFNMHGASIAFSVALSSPDLREHQCLVHINAALYKSTLRLPRRHRSGQFLALSGDDVVEGPFPHTCHSRRPACFSSYSY